MNFIICLALSCNGHLHAVDRPLLLGKSVRLSSAMTSQALMRHYNIGRLDVA